MGTGNAWRVAGLALLAWVAAAVLGSGVVGEFPKLSGDEPHYLVIAQSLALDGDLELRDDYAEQRYRSFLGPEAWIQPHVTDGARPGSQYSFHAPGLGILLAPLPVGFGSIVPAAYRLATRTFMGLWGALLAVALWLTLERLAGARTAFGGAALAVLTPPFLFNAASVFPDMPAAALSALAYETGRRAAGRTAGLLAAGLFLAPVAWLHFKFLPLMGMVVAAVMVQLATELTGNDAADRGPAMGHGAVASSRQRQLGGAFAVLIAGPLVGILGYAAYTWSAFGSLSPFAVVPASATISNSGLLPYLADPLGVVRTAVGLLLDQKEGLLFLAPHYGLAVLGAAWLARRRAMELACLLIVFVAYLFPVALSQNVALYGPPGRWLVAGLWPLAILAGLGLMVPVTGQPLRWVRGTALGFGSAITLLFALNPWLAFIDAQTTRSRLLQQYGGPGLEPWRLLPVWFHYATPQWWVTVVWSLAAVGGAVWLWRAVRRQPDAVPVAASWIPHPCALRAFTGAFGLVAALAFAHWALVPIPGGEAVQGRAYERVRVEVSQYPPRPFLLENDAFWVGGAEPVRAALSSRRPIARIDVNVALRPHDTNPPPGRLMPDPNTVARICVAADCAETTGAEEQPLSLRPGEGQRWGDRYYYRLQILADPPGERFEARLQITSVEFDR